MRRQPRAARIAALAGAALVAALQLCAPAPAQAAAASFDLVVSAAQHPGDAQVMVVQQGDEVTLKVTTELPVEVHVHGYEIEEAAAPGKPASVHFRAHATGRFPVEIHLKGGHRVIGYLEVHPR